ncbi:DinB family protein [Sphingobacterium allocomposti]|uniref:DinB family protein n=1 Tax=Sphingobacterium allocomposti TaxID=415956 RepID=A0A5S5DQZ0_9SPHI|nr:putative metal-dependent hydrolase [Sphingobacterium composti Yoo et al. 2007 non Ten et al. 2007]TYP97079.1 DinB family protein [Sphingobacterium composti Yoo et al. 2007 non Ten et al. 2007]
MSKAITGRGFKTIIGIFADMENNIDTRRYPIGKFQKPEIITTQTIARWIDSIESFPARLNKEVNGLTDRELAKRYRPEGWTIRQLVHHCADSHMNSFIRFKLTLTEETPTIKPYLEDLWTELPDASHLPIDSSLDVLKGLHRRWTALLKSLTEEDLKRQFIHPETNERISLETNIGIYAWHGDHHLAHIVHAKRSEELGSDIAT